ncbi:MAG: carbon monoxide dehydrogenase, partial [Desulfurococcales archaeon ex4484_58]
MSWDLNRSNTHIIPFEFEYHEPKSLDEAVELLKKLGSEAKVLAGGTDLLIQMKMGVLRPKHIINLKKINGLNLIVDKGEYLSIGALTKLRDIEKNEIIK